MGDENLGIVGYPTVYRWRGFRVDVSETRRWRVRERTLGFCDCFVLEGTLNIERGGLESIRVHQHKLSRSERTSNSLATHTPSIGALSVQ